MPEIKRVFSAGKMNKDLDERLVPNGEYRDALNIRVNTSDASDVGAINNILGNTKIFPDLSKPSGSSITFDSNAQCVAAVSDEKNNCFYWFVQNSGTSDLIIKYDILNETAIPIVVDDFSQGGTLKFQRNNIITGINIIDDLLFWTDNYSEPKKINVENCRLGTPNFTRHTRLHNPILDNLHPPAHTFSGYSESTEHLKEEHITVIKRAPKQAPYMELVSDELYNLPGIIKNYRFSDGAGTLWSPGNYPNATGGVINFAILNSGSQRQYNITPGETIILLKSVETNEIGYDTDSDGLIDQLNQNFNQEYSYSNDYDIRLKITSVSDNSPLGQSHPPAGSPLTGLADVHAEILSINPNTTLDFSTWVVNFEQPADTLFEEKFARFAYRYKYIDSEYSPFSPFTRVAFNASVYSQDTTSGYNLGMRNNLREIILAGFVSKEYKFVGSLPPDRILSEKIPHDVIGIDLLYKESNSPAVYIVDSISPYNTEWFATPTNPLIALYGGGEYSITSDTIYKIIEENQLLRSFDSVPKKALAQETVGNRIVYANYEQNMDLDNSPIDLDFSYNQRNGFNSYVVDEVGAPSIKSIRNYQLGIVYEDKYGRQTPVLTNKDAVLKVPITQSTTPTAFRAKINSTPPVEAQTYKFYIKETSSEYYNLSLARWYNASDDNIWLSFNSSDRNKVDEEDYLYLKKGHGTDNAVVISNKYKVLAIANEAPDFIKTNRKSLGKLEHSTANNDLLFNEYTFLPIKGKTNFRVNTTVIESSGYADIAEKSNLEMILSNPSSSDFSDRYEITNVVKDSLNPSGYIITIQGAFGSDVNFIEDSTSTASLPVIENGIVLEITEGIIKNKPEFDGKFFVKINKDFNITNYILPFSGNADDMAITHQEPLLYHHPFISVDLPSVTGGNNWTTALFNMNSMAGRGQNYSLQMAYDDAEVYFGDGTTSDTTLPNGPKWFIDATPHEGEAVYDSNGDLITSGGSYSPGTNNGINGNQIDISYSGIITPGNNFTDMQNGLGWLVGESANSETDHEVTMVSNLSVGKQFYFADDIDKTLYTIVNVNTYELYNYVNYGSNLPFLQTAYSYPRNKRKTWRLTLDKQIGLQSYDPRSAASPVSATNAVAINFVENLDSRDGSEVLTKNPAVFETKPKRNDGLDIYHEASISYDITLHGWQQLGQELNFSNCFTFGNGVESDRIRDDFNAATIDNGPKVSTVFEGEYQKETVSNRLTYSGIYNSKNSFNRTNEFISAEKITKDLNPEYGSIQKLHTRNSDLVALCEDKVVRIYANKDALFNADGNVNLTATNKVLGQAIPFAGDYGISTDPSSFASDNYRVYFTDKQRGAVLRLSMDGLTPISEYGMSDYFKDNLKLTNRLIGSFDDKNDEYNVSFLFKDPANINNTVSFDEKAKGWVSFKSFVPEVAFSSSSNYYSFDKGNLYQHDIGFYNNFYNDFTNSTVNVLFNEVPSSVKTFKTLNYEGSQAKVVEETTDVRSGYYNLNQKQGWHVSSINTDQDEGQVAEFIKKEGKWFNYIKGINNII